MKKFLGIMVIAVMFMLPITVNAKVVSAQENCTDISGVQTAKCIPSAQVEGETEFQVVITPTNVTIDEASIEAVDIDWDVTSKVRNSDGTYTVTVKSTTGSALTGTYSLFSVSYTKDANATDCHVKFTFPSGSTPAPTPDTPTENKQTGSTLPFIALGSLVVLAGAAYIVTKNQTKMYKI